MYSRLGEVRLPQNETLPHDKLPPLENGGESVGADFIVTSRVPLLLFQTAKLVLDEYFNSPMPGEAETCSLDGIPGLQDASLLGSAIYLTLSLSAILVSVWLTHSRNIRPRDVVIVAEDWQQC